VRQPVAITSVTQVNATTWQASFALPTDAGLGAPETLSFSQQTSDDLDNVSTRITAANLFQVYQGSLPPAAVPLGLLGKAQPAGKVQLTWLAVDEAFAYQVYRQGPNEATLMPLARSAGVQYVDTVPADGKYVYAVASVRQSNGQESLSDKSASVEVSALTTAPGAPQNLTLALTSQGIKASWQAPLASTVDYYNLYRSSGTSVTSIAGLTPIKTRVKSLLTYDPAPSPTQGAYVVTAVDAAGNESAMSNSAYLNASLLPVINPQVLQIGTSLPTLTWTPPNGNVAGYHLYVGPDASRTRLTSTPITGTTFIDTGYTSGERRYTISTVDGNGQEIGRSIALPAITTQIVSGLPILRGVMNRLQVQVANTSAGNVDNAKVVVRLPINKDQTQFKEHRSEPFSLAPNQTSLATVVVGGYADLPASPTLQVGIESSPNEGELIKIARNQVVDTADSALVVGMTTGDFTRGATGKVRLTVENTSEVEVELLTALSNGTAASNELRFKILDADGNVLSTQPYKQAIGANVITLPTGQTVARIPAGSSFTSDVFELAVPGSSPNIIRVKLEVDKLRYHTGREDEVAITGRGTEKSVNLLETAYYGELTDVSPLISFGDQDIVITGRAVDRATTQALPNTRLKLILNQQGFERVFSVLTDPSGSFNYVFKPTATDGGFYKVSAIHPDLTDRPEQKSFTINRVTFGPTPYKLDLPRNYSFSVPFIARSGPGTSATNMRMVIEPSAQPTGQLPAGVQLQLPNPVSIGERAQMNMPVVFSANNDAQPTGSVILTIYSDERPQGGGTPLGQVRLDYALSEAKPYLVSTPSLIETGLAQGSSQTETVYVQNKGLQDAVNLSFALTKPDGTPAPSWVSLTGQVNGNLAVGEKRPIDVAFMPPADLAEGVYEFRLKVTGDNVPAQSMNVYASVTQSGQGNVLFRASDIYTGTLDKSGNVIQGLAGSTVVLQNEDVTTVTYQLNTDSLGEAYFQNVPSGRYTYRARASNHQEVAGRILVKPGITLIEPIFLNYNLITVEWSVREVTIADRYEITIDATFETDVPAAVVVAQPSSINLPKMKAGDVFYGEITLTNYGLIRADHVTQKLPPSDPYFRYEFLVELPPSLEPKQKVTIPYRVVALQSLDPADAGGAASGGGCYSYSNTTIFPCDYICKNGVQSSCETRVSWFSISNSCTISTGGGIGGGSGGYGGGGGGFGGVSGGTSTALPPPKGKKCVGIPGGKNSCD
jgi:large repetitive protein